MQPWNAIAVDSTADVRSRGNKETTFSNEYREVAEKDKGKLLAYGSKDPFAYDYNGACTAFANGESAMYTIGSYAIPQIQDSKSRYGYRFCTLANNDASENKLNSGVDLQFSVMKDCGEQREAAYEVLNFLLKDEKCTELSG